MDISGLGCVATSQLVCKARHSFPDEIHDCGATGTGSCSLLLFVPRRTGFLAAWCSNLGRRMEVAQYISDGY